MPRRPALRYKVQVFDEEIKVCEIRFADEDLANMIGNILQQLLVQTMAVNVDESRNPGHLFDDFLRDNGPDIGWAGSGFDSPPPPEKI